MTKVKCPKCGATNPSDESKCGRCGGTLPQVRVQSGDGGQRQAPPGRHGHHTFQKGQVVANRYTILDVIGRGGMGCIYKVYDNTLKEEVALKTLLPQYVQDKLVVDRFFNEARIARQLSHPGIVRVHDIGLADGSVYISMELLKGQSLRSMMDKMGPGRRIPVKSTLQLMIQLCTALEYAHQFTVHRDIKPENVMVMPNGTVKLMDFGISKLMSNQSLTATSVIMGTPHYMSPEQIKDSRNVDARADVYSIGVMLYEILTGNLPTGIPKPASQIIKDLPPSLDPIVEKCVEPQPINRYQNVSDLKQALTSILEIVSGGSVAPAPKPGGSTTAAPGTSGLRKVVGIVLILIVAGLTALGVWGLTSRRTFPLREAQAAGTEPAEISQAEIEQARYERTAEYLRLAGNRTLSLQGSEELQPILERGAALAEAATQLASDDVVRANRLAEQALQCYLAVLPPRPNDMVFVAPGDIDEDGFYISAAPVTVGQFSQFASTSGWGDYGSLSAEAAAHPLTNVPFYAAIAYATANDLELPTAAQWDRAFQQHPQTMASGYYEWTRTAARGNGEQSIPDFGDQILLRAAYVDQDGNPVLDGDRMLNFDGAGPQVGFRCVRRIATSPASVEARLRD
ncbi:MAG: protein kinase [Candidatus Hydrogenedentes bacterium]|nr:protein kinase [Candidatus Hydrogenedentota bacterium]